MDCCAVDVLELLLLMLLAFARLLPSRSVPGVGKLVGESPRDCIGELMVHSCNSRISRSVLAAVSDCVTTTSELFSVDESAKCDCRPWAITDAQEKEAL